MLTAPIMIHFAKHYPKFHVDIFRSNTVNLTQMLRERLVDALIVDIRSLRPSPDLKVQEMVEMKGTFMCRKAPPGTTRTGESGAVAPISHCIHTAKRRVGKSFGGALPAKALTPKPW
jgi:DNA-binding transcriptional LysR family regulator